MRQAGNPFIPEPLGHRAYIGVYLYTTPGGDIQPRRIRWEDGTEWDIDRIIDVRPGVARKAGGAGMRYLVRIGRHERVLYLVDGKWFVEV
jgi:hypothetical protein